MTISTVSQTKTFAIALDATTQDQIVIINSTNNLTLGSDYIPNHKLVAFNVFLKNLKAHAKIESLEEALLPNFALEDSATDKLYKVLDVEWKSPRKQLDLLMNSGGNDWSIIGSVSVLNPAGYPFRVYSLFDLLTDNLTFEMGVNTSIAVQMKDVGFGFLEGTDIITVHGSYTEEMFLASNEPPININVSVIGGSGGGGNLPPSTEINNTATIDNNFTFGN